jgi:DNA-binding MarR family transcriptional regulator
VVQLPCACANLRRAARVVTQFYDEALRPQGMRVTQFTLLQALHHAGGINQKHLAKLLEMDTTTLTRTLALLSRENWLHSEQGSDRREIRLSLTAAGEREYERVLPFWRAAQKRLTKELGEAKFSQLVEAAVGAAGLTLS